MKLICLALLLVFTFQLRLSGHDQENPLSGKQFTIKSNVANANINGVKVSFGGDLTFYGCNPNSAPYYAVDGRLAVFDHWRSTRKGCPHDDDWLLRILLNQSLAYELNDKELTTKDKEGNIILTLTQTN